MANKLKSSSFREIKIMAENSASQTIKPDDPPPENFPPSLS
jgi:hypothetical protein